MAIGLMTRWLFIGGVFAATVAQGQVAGLAPDVARDLGYVESPPVDNSWGRAPIPVVFGVGIERRMSFPAPVKVKIPADRHDVLKVRNVSQSLYWTATEPVQRTEVLVQRLDTGRDLRPRYHGDRIGSRSCTDLHRCVTAWGRQSRARAGQTEAAWARPTEIESVRALPHADAIRRATALRTATADRHPERHRPHGIGRRCHSPGARRRACRAGAGELVGRGSARDRRRAQHPA